MIDADGNSVTGAFVNEKVNGPGELKTSGGLSISGVFKDGELSGKCVIQWVATDFEYKFKGVCAGL
jgi:hypothetical protein